MKNLTISVDEKALHNARIRAMQQGTSLNAVLKEFIESFAGSLDAQNEAANQIMSLSRQSRSARGNALWSRDDLYKRK